MLAHPLLPRSAAEGPDEDARISAMVSRIRAAGALAGSEAGSPPVADVVKSRIAPECELSPPATNLLCTRWGTREGVAFFLVNTSSQPYAGSGIFRSAGVPVRCDPSTGEVQPLPHQKTSGPPTRVALALRPFESLFVAFR